MEMDSVMAKDEMLRSEFGGSTAVVVLLKDNVIYCVSILHKVNFSSLVLNNIFL